MTKQRTPGELLARERKVAKTSLFQQLNRVSCKTEVFVFPVLWSPLYKDNDPMSPLMLLRQPSQSSRVHTSGTLVWHIPLKSLSPSVPCWIVWAYYFASWQCARLYFTVYTLHIAWPSQCWTVFDEQFYVPHTGPTKGPICYNFEQCV